MSRMAKAFKAFGMILGKPWLLNKIVESDEEFMKQVKKKYGISALPVVPVETFLGNSFTIDPYSFLDGTSTPVDLALLRALASGFKDCRYLEIGTWRGESVANVAAVAKECVTVNLSDNEMRKRGWDERYIRSHRKLSAGLTNVKHVDGNSLSDDLSYLGKFDLIFIDGDHHYKSVRSDTEKFFHFLKDENSVMVWHDYAFSPLQPRGEVLLGILDGLPKQAHSHLYQPSHSMCCIYLAKPLPEQAFNAYPDSVKTFIISVKTDW